MTATLNLNLTGTPFAAIDETKVANAIEKLRTTEPKLYKEFGGDTDPLFALYMRCIDAAVGKLTGVGVHDLADANFRGMYTDGISPRVAARQVIADN